MEGIDSIITQLEQQKDAIDRALSALREIGLGTSNAVTEPTTPATGRSTRKFSPATRRKMALAQQRRYAALRGETGADKASAKTAKQTKPAKRKMSAEGLANIRAAVKRRWALAKKKAPIA